ncbi:autotransporter-associated beta strand repeat-containing protein, partial [bacterium]|nr:autotransporter-associated beta strand repeat-containing protein [bacterium]
MNTRRGKTAALGCVAAMLLVLGLGGVAQAQFIFDLADAVGGGNGSLPGTGGFGDIGGNVAVYTTSANTYVDGYFVPNNTPGPITIDGASNSYDFDATTSAGYYNPWRNGLNLDMDPSSAAGLPNFNGDPNNHSLLSGHANKGITFDLDAVRTATGQEPHQFTTYAGDSRPKGGGSITYYVIVDGVVKQTAAKTDSEDFVTLALSPTDRYLTLVVSDSNNGIGADHGYFGDPFLHASTYTWDGGDGTSQNWSTHQNWGADVAPISSASTQIIIGGNNNIGTSGTPLNQDIATPFQLNRLVSGNVAAGDLAVYLGGGQLQFVADGATQPTLHGDRDQTTHIANAIDIAATTLTVTNRTWHINLNGPVTGGGALVFDASAGSGGLTLANGSNSYTGGTTFIGGGAADQWDKFNVTDSGALGTGTVTLQGGNTTAYGGGNTQPGGLIFIGTGKTHANDFDIQADSPIYIGEPGQAGHAGYSVTLTGAVNLNANDLYLRGRGTGTISGAITGTGGLVKIDPATWTLTNRSNNYTGDTTVDEGTLVLNGANATSSLIGSGDLIINTGARVDTYVNSFGYSPPKNDIFINGGTLNQVANDSHLAAVSMTAGTLSGTEFRLHNNVTVNAAATSSLISVNALNLQTGIVFDVADGAADHDLLIT